MSNEQPVDKRTCTRNSVLAPASLFPEPQCVPGLLVPASRITTLTGRVYGFGQNIDAFNTKVQSCLYPTIRCKSAVMKFTKRCTGPCESLCKGVDIQRYCTVSFLQFFMKIEGWSYRTSAIQRYASSSQYRRSIKSPSIKEPKF